MQIQKAFKDYSRNKVKIFKQLKTNNHRAFVNTQEAKNMENKTFLGMSQVSYMILSKLS